MLDKIPTKKELKQERLLNRLDEIMSGKSIYSKDIELVEEDCEYFEYSDGLAYEFNEQEHHCKIHCKW